MESLINQLQDLFPSLSIAQATKVLIDHNKDVEASINHLLTNDQVDNDNVQQEDEKLKEEKENERLLKELLDKENNEVNIINSQKEYDCSICYNEQTIGDFYIMDECEHRFCNDCLVYHYTNQISMNFPNIKCPERNCKRIVTYTEVQHIIGKTTDLFEKYDKLLLQSHLNKDNKIKYCPYPDCKNAMIVNGDETDIMCTNDECGYSFCTGCREESHRGFTCDEWQENLLFLVQNTVVNVEPTNEQLHRDHHNRMASIQSRNQRSKFWRGRKWINYDQIKAHKDVRGWKWIKEFTVTCPSCQVIIEKNGGCNHMTCRMCNSHFCWKCGKLENKHNHARFPC